MKMLIEISFVFLLMVAVALILQVLGVEAVIGSGLTAAISMIVGLYVAEKVFIQGR